MKHIWIKITLGSFALLLAACVLIETPSFPDERLPLPGSGTQTGHSDSSPTPDPQKDTSSMTQPVPSHLSSGMESLVEKAREDLAQRLSITISEISLLEAREVVWPDASLGCPQPGMAYKQVPEDGALIILQVEGLNYNYHAGGSRGLFLCEQLFKSPEKPPQIDITKLTPPSPEGGDPPGQDQ